MTGLVPVIHVNTDSLHPGAVIARRRSRRSNPVNVALDRHAAFAARDDGTIGGSAHMEGRHCEEANADEAIQCKLFWIATPLSRLKMTALLATALM